MAIELGDILFKIQGDKSPLQSIMKSAESDIQGWAQRLQSSINQGVQGVMRQAAASIQATVNGTNQASNATQKLAAEQAKAKATASQYEAQLKTLEASYSQLQVRTDTYRQKLEQATASGKLSQAEIEARGQKLTAYEAKLVALQDKISAVQAKQAVPPEIKIPQLTNPKPVKVPVEADSSKLSSGLSEAQSRIRSWASTTGDIIKGALSTALGIGIAQVTGAVMGGVGALFEKAKSAAIDFNAELAQLKIGFTQLTGSAQVADQLLKDMQAFAAQTPLTFEQLATLGPRLLNAGIAANQIIPLLKSVGDAVAAVGGNAESIDRVTLAMSQMIAKGKVNAQDMNQLAEAGINGWNMLAEKLGMTKAQVIALAEQGKISAATFMEAFQEFSDKHYEGAMEKISKTWNGALSTISDNLQQFFATSAKPAFEGATELANNFANALSSPEIQAAAQVIAEVVSGAMSEAGKALSGFKLNLSDLGQWGYNVASAFVDGFSYIVEGVAEVLIAVTTLISDFLEGHSPPKKGKLSRIDTWFGPVLNAYLQGWQKADFSILDDLAGQVEKRLKDQVDAGQLGPGLFANIANYARTYIAVAIDEINKYGEIGQQTLENIRNTVGESADSVIAQLEAYKDVSGAEHLLEVAQKQLDVEQQKLDLIKSQHDERRAQLDDERQALQDQKADLDDATKDKTRPIDLQIHALERQQHALQAAEDSAKTKADKDNIRKQIDATREQINALRDQKQVIEDQSQEQQDNLDEQLRQQQRNARHEEQTMKAEEKAQQQKVDQQKQSVDQAKENVKAKQDELDVLKAQIAEQEKLLDIQRQGQKMAEAAAAAAGGKGAGGKGAGGAGGLKGALAGLGAAGGGAGGLGGLKTSVAGASAEIQAKIAEIKKKFEDALGPWKDLKEKMGESLGKLGESVDGLKKKLDDLFNLSPEAFFAKLEQAAKNPASPVNGLAKAILDLNTAWTHMEPTLKRFLFGETPGNRTGGGTAIDFGAGEEDQSKHTKGNKAEEGQKDILTRLKDANEANNAAYNQSGFSQAINSAGESFRHFLLVDMPAWFDQSRAAVLPKLSQISADIFAKLDEWAKNLGTIGPAFQHVFSDIADNAGHMKDDTAKWFGQQQDNLGNAAKWLGENVKKPFGDVFSDIGTNAQHMKEDTAKWFGQQQDNLGNAASWLDQNVKKPFGDTFSDIGKNAHDMMDETTKWFGQQRDNIGSIKDSVLKILGEIANGFTHMLDGVHIKLPHFKITGNLLDPTSWASQPPSVGVDWYGQGGIVADPRIIGVGEAGPEAIIPLNDRKRAMEILREAGMLGDPAGTMEQAAAYLTAGRGLATSGLMVPELPAAAAETLIGNYVASMEGAFTKYQPRIEQIGTTMGETFGKGFQKGMDPESVVTQAHEDFAGKMADIIQRSFGLPSGTLGTIG